jgi:sarcosine oxidase subunit gamma
MTPLGLSAPQRCDVGPMILTETAPTALASLALRRGTAPPAPLGLALPGPGGWRAGAGIAAFWTGSDQWMIEGADQTGTDFAARLARAAPGCSVTDQTDGWARFELASAAGAGAGAGMVEQAMARLVNLDPRRFGPESATRTLLHHLPVFVIRPADDRLAVLGPRSFAASLWRSLAQVAADVAPAEPGQGADLLPKDRNVGKAGADAC